jgi:hypothetical protein
MVLIQKLIQHKIAIQQKHILRNRIEVLQIRMPNIFWHAKHLDKLGKKAKQIKSVSIIAQ